MRLIDADPLYTDIQKHFEGIKKQREQVEDEDLHGMLCGEILENRKLCKMLRNAPTIDAAPVVHAHWISGVDGHGYPYCFCSECKKDAIFKDIFSEHVKSPFCPNCGARMDGDPHDNPGQ